MTKYPYCVVLDVIGLNGYYEWCCDNISDFNDLWKYTWHHRHHDLAEIRFWFVNAEDFVRFKLIYG